MAAADRLRAAQVALQNPNVRAFLDVIADAEGVNHGYNTLFGNEVIQSLDDHPRTQRAFRETNGKRNSTSAAGRYQFLEKTWDDVAGKLGLQDFSPQSQDLAAVELLRRNGALESLQQGDFSKAVQQSGGTWASLPSSPYAQPTRSQDFIAQAVQRARGSTAAQPAGNIDQLVAELMGAGPAAQPPEGADLLSQVSALTTAAAPPESLSPPAASLPQWATDLQKVQSQAQDSATVPMPESDEPDDWTQQLIGSGLSNLADEARSNAVASFLGEEPVRRTPLPPALEQAIMRAIASA